MYEELVKSLRDCAGVNSLSLYKRGLMKQAANAIEELADTNVGKWISVEERLPEEEELVLCYTPVDGYMFVGYHFSYKRGSNTVSKWRIITSMRSTKDITKKVTHWRLLPEPPKEET